VSADITCRACAREAPEGKFVEFGSWDDLMRTGRAWTTTWVCDDTCAGVLSEREGRPARPGPRREDLEMLIEKVANDTVEDV